MCNCWCISVPSIVDHMIFGGCSEPQGESRGGSSRTTAQDPSFVIHVDNIYARSSISRAARARPTLLHIHCSNATYERMASETAPAAVRASPAPRPGTTSGVDTGGGGGGNSTLADLTSSVRRSEGDRPPPLVSFLF